MRTAKKKDELYEIRLRNQQVNLKKSVILLPSFNSRMQHFVPTPNHTHPTPVSTITSPLPIVIDSKICNDNDNDKNLQYIKSKIMLDYSNLYKTV